MYVGLKFVAHQLTYMYMYNCTYTFTAQKWCHNQTLVTLNSRSS